ncbi:MAG: hypothetical protein JW913_12300 [Chitinispirillaceae bacterium]|nr:hypothetical protein [Chitinispirillaceae bacterium]
MLENVADGFLGLFMFFAHWLSPGNDRGEIRIEAVRELKTRSVLECFISFEWNERMSDLIDAGIPMRFRILSYSDRGDSTLSIRTLFCDVGEYTYYISDSLIVPAIDSVYVSKEYRQIYRALREYRHVMRSFARSASYFQIEAVLLPSRVSHLNRSIDMSDICGCRRFATRVISKQRGK